MSFHSCNKACSRSWMVIGRLGWRLTRLSSSSDKCSIGLGLVRTLAMEEHLRCLSAENSSPLLPHAALRCPVAESYCADGQMEQPKEQMIYQRIRSQSSTKQLLVANRVLLMLLLIETYKPVPGWKILELPRRIRVPGAMRQRGRFAGFSLYVSNTTDRHSGYLCYKDGPELPPLDFNTNCITHGRYVIFYNERLPGTIYPIGYEVSPVLTELCEVTVRGCSSFGVYGDHCDKVCPENCQERRCDIINGTCLGCTPGWVGAYCDKACTAGYYGLQCESKCVGHCKDSVVCNHINGLCDNGCDDGWIGFRCIKECPMGTYGPACVHKCSGKCLGDVACNRTTGKCDPGCDSGYTGELCETGCEMGTFGKGCSYRCSRHCLNNVTCNSTTGHCDSGCASGYVEPFCSKTDLEITAFGENCNDPSYIAALSVMVFVSIVLGSVCLLFMWKYYRLVKRSVLCNTPLY